MTKKALLLQKKKKIGGMYILNPKGPLLVFLG